MARDLQRNRRKTADRARALLPPGTNVRGIFVGQSQARWTNTATVLVVVMVAIVAVGALLGDLLVPGIMLFVGLIHTVRPVRVIVLADQGVASLSRSFWTGRPQAVLGYESLLAINGVLAGSTSKIAIGPDVLTLRSREVKGLSQVAPQPFAESGQGVVARDLASGQS